MYSRQIFVARYVLATFVRRSLRTNNCVVGNYFQDDSKDAYLNVAIVVIYIQRAYNHLQK